MQDEQQLLEDQKKLISQQEKDLVVISQSLERIKNIAQGTNDELLLQKGLLNNLEKGVTKTKEKIEYENKRMDFLSKGKATSSWTSWFW
eukprot:gene7691-12157_t